MRYSGKGRYRQSYDAGATGSLEHPCTGARGKYGEN